MKLTFAAARQDVVSYCFQTAFTKIDGIIDMSEAIEIRKQLDRAIAIARGVELDARPLA